MLLRSRMLDGVDGRQGGQPADDRPGQSFLQSQDKAGAKRVAGPGGIDDSSGLGRRDFKFLTRRR